MRSILRMLYRFAAWLFVGSGIERISPIGKLNKIITAFIRTPTVQIDGHIFHLDDCDSMNLSVLPNYEPSEATLFRKEIREGDTVVDLGANIGYFTVLFSELVGDVGSVYAFEPDPENFTLLEKNVSENSCTNVCAERVAVTDSVGTSYLYRSPTETTDHRLYNSDDNRDYVEVQITSLNNYFAKFDEGVDFIKIDVQGVEPLVLSEMDQLLEKSPRMKILTEFWPFGLDKSGIAPEDFVESLEDKGFALFEYSEYKKAWEPTNSKTLLKKHTIKNQLHTNIFCTKAG